MKQIMQILGMLIVTSNCLAQADKRNEAMDIMRRLADRYQVQAGLSFDIAYKYSLENSPSVLLDSLSGQCKIKGSRYWYQLDKTESVHTGDCMVMIFREDEVMYLTKPSSSAGLANPLAMIDSLLIKNKDISYNISDEKEWLSLVLNFPAHKGYKRIEYRIDKQSGLLQKMISIVRNELLSGMPPAQSAGNTEAYAIVETIFSNYRRGGIDESLFDSNRYFKKDGNEYIAMAPFEQYKVFLGSPGM